MHANAKPTPVDAATELEAFILDRIPLARAMQLQIHACSGDHIVLRAPLAPNVNDKGCAFGGSLSSLMTLAPWALLELGLRDAGIDADLFVADAEIRYLAPLFDDIEVLARPTADASLAQLCQTLRRKGRARIAMHSQVVNDGRQVCVQSARFVAKLRNAAQ